MSYHVRQSSVKFISLIHVNHVRFVFLFEFQEIRNSKFCIFRVTLASRVSAIDGSGQTRDYADAPCLEKSTNDDNDETRMKGEKRLKKEIYMYAFHAQLHGAIHIFSEKLPKSSLESVNFSHSA